MKQFFCLVFAVCFCGCSLLGIHIVDDSLTAKQHNDLGISYEQQNKLQLAEKEYKQAIKKKSNWHVPYFNLGNVYYKLLQKGEAIKYYRSGLRIDPKNSDIMNNLAFVLMEIGKCSEAKEWIEKAIAIEAKPEYISTKNEIEAKLSDRH